MRKIVILAIVLATSQTHAFDAGTVHTRLETVCPLIGVSIGRNDDKNSWAVEFSNACTAEQRKQALELMAATDFTAADAAWTPAQIVALLEKWGIADEVLKGMTPLEQAKFFTAPSIPADHPVLLSTLQASGKTVNDLKQAIGK